MNDKNIKIFFLFTCFLVYYIAWYFHYNLPVFQQIFAHYTYVKTDVANLSNNDKKYENTNFSCIAISCIRSRSFLDQNKLNDCHSHLDIIKNHTYIVDGKEYFLRNSFYSDGKRECGFKNTAYYFPFYPAWSVFDKKLPHEKYLYNLLKTSVVLVALIFIFLFVRKNIFLDQKPFERLKDNYISNTRFYILVSSYFVLLFTGLLLSHFEIITKISKWSYSLDFLERKDQMIVRTLVQLVVFLLPTTLLLFFKYPSSIKKKTLIIPLILILFFGFNTGLYLFITNIFMLLNLV